MAKTILHIDMDAYFATVAQIVYPQYKNVPLAVGGKSSRSIISTASYEARKYGVHSAMPTYLARQKCPNLVIVSPQFAIYEKYTRWFISIARKYADKIQLVSIDECFVDITDNLKKSTLAPLQYIAMIQKDICETTGLSCSIGVGPNKFLAKMASDYRKPMVITIIRKRDIQAVLWPLPVGKMYGCGKKTTAMLENEFSIHTIGDLATCDKPEVSKRLGQVYTVLHAWANGIGDDEVSEEQQDAKSIGNSETLLSDTNTYEEIVEEITRLSKKVANRAQKQNLYGTGVQLVIKYSNFKVINRSKTLDRPFNDEQQILDLALHLFDANYNQTQSVRLLGVTLINVAVLSSFVKQLSIFDKPEIVQKDTSKINSLIKAINNQLGKDILLRASQVEKGTDKL